MAAPNKKTTIVILLFISCMASASILLSTPAYNLNVISSQEQIDSIIVANLDEYLIQNTAIRKSSVQVDSLFYRSIFNVEVPPTFSKTMFHYDMNRDFIKYGIKTPAKVTFPEKNMDIYIYYKDNIQSTVRFITKRAKQNE